MIRVTETMKIISCRREKRKKGSMYLKGISLTYCVRKVWIGAWAKDTTKLRILAPRLATFFNWLVNVNFFAQCYYCRGLSCAFCRLCHETRTFQVHSWSADVCHSETKSIEGSTSSFINSTKKAVSAHPVITNLVILTI